jgi:ferrochelatase
MKTGVILLAQGFPSDESQLDQYLTNLFPEGGEGNSTKVELANALRKIGGECPQGTIIQKQCSALDEALPIKVYLGMRLWEPSIYTAVAEAKKDRVGRLIGISLTPQYAKGSVGECQELLKSIAKDMKIIPVWSWASHPLFINYWVSQIKKGSTVLFTAPTMEQSKAGLYQSELQETIRAIQKRVSIEAHLGFHSIVPVPEPHTGPDIWEVIKLLRKKEEIVVAPIGFTSDQVEVLFNLDRHYKKRTENLGVKWTRLPVPNSNPIFTATLARVVHSVL